MQNKKEGVKLARRPKKEQPAPPVAPAPAPAPAASATAVPASSRDSVYREAKAADEELRKLVAGGKVQLDRAVTQSRNRLRQHLESVRFAPCPYLPLTLVFKLLFIDYAFAQQKDIELQLWKNCFYKVRLCLMHQRGRLVSFFGNRDSGLECLMFFVTLSHAAP